MGGQDEFDGSAADKREAPPDDQTFERALKLLEAEVPPAAAKIIERLRQPNATYIRIPVAILCIAGGFLWFLPLLGIWMMPLGLLLLAFDVPVLRKPVARLTVWMLDKWVALRAWARATLGTRSGRGTPVVSAPDREAARVRARG